MLKTRLDEDEALACLVKRIFEWIIMHSIPTEIRTDARPLAIVIFALIALVTAQQPEAQQYDTDFNVAPLLPYMQAWPDNGDPYASDFEPPSPQQVRLNRQRIVLSAPTPDIRQDAREAFAASLPAQISHAEKAVSASFADKAPGILAKEWKTYGLDARNFADCMSALALSSCNIANRRPPGLKGFTKAQIKGVRDQMREHIANILPAEISDRHLQVIAEQVRAEYIFQKFVIQMVKLEGENPSDARNFLVERGEYFFDME